MTRRCSHCSNNGHNTRTCPSRGGGGGGSGVGVVKLFGVRLTDGSIIKKSASMGNLSSAHFLSSAAASPNPSSPSSDHLRDQPIQLADGYLSDDPGHATCSSNRRGERKKGVPWTEEEHRLFLVGLQKLGKGDWRGIARNFVVSRTPTQVASHAQKYFMRRINTTRRKQRPSLFDMPPNMAMDPPPATEEQSLLPAPQTRETENTSPMPCLDLSLNSEFEPMEATTSHEKVEAKPSSNFASTFYPTSYLSVPCLFWPTNENPPEEEKPTPVLCHHQVLKPIPILPKEPVNVDELVGMSQLSLGEIENGHRPPSPLSLKLTGGPARQSAFHANTAVSASNLNDGKSSAIQAV